MTLCFVRTRRQFHEAPAIGQTHHTLSSTKRKYSRFDHMPSRPRAWFRICYNRCPALTPVSSSRLSILPLVFICVQESCPNPVLGCLLSIWRHAEAIPVKELITFETIYIGEAKVFTVSATSSNFLATTRFQFHRYPCPLLIMPLYAQRGCRHPS